MTATLTCSDEFTAYGAMMYWNDLVGAVESTGAEPSDEIVEEMTYAWRNYRSTCFVGDAAHPDR